MKYGFDFVELDGNGTVGLLSTGAGLTMALVDMLKERGCSPINFVDIRTGGLHGDPTRLVVALKRIMAAPNLRCILINVFAGLTDLVEFAQTLLKALQQFRPLHVPVLARLQGDNAGEANDLLAQSGIDVFASLDDVAVRVSELGVK